MNIKHETRRNRNGYKAGALKEGLEKEYVNNCDFVAIFDADFQPDEDFLWRTIPYLLENPKLGLVQSRWKFGNTALLHCYCHINLTACIIIESIKSRLVLISLLYVQ